MISLNQRIGLFHNQVLTLNEKEVQLTIRRLGSVIKGNFPLEILDINERELKIYSSLARIFAVAFLILSLSFAVIYLEYTTKEAGSFALASFCILLISVILKLKQGKIYKFFYTKATSELVLVMLANKPSKGEIDNFINGMKEYCRKRYDMVRLEELPPSYAEEIRRLHELKSSGIITAEEFKIRKEDILRELAGL